MNPNLSKNLSPSAAAAMDAGDSPPSLSDAGSPRATTVESSTMSAPLGFTSQTSAPPFSYYGVLSHLGFSLPEVLFGSSSASGFVGSQPSQMRRPRPPSPTTSSCYLAQPSRRLHTLPLSVLASI